MTLADFYRRVLEKLQVVAAGESAAAEDTIFVAGKYETVWNMARPMGLVSWAVGEEIPDEAVEPMTVAVAHVCASEFGDEPANYDGALGFPQPSLAERQLRALHARDYVSTPAQSEYF